MAHTNHISEEEERLLDTPTSTSPDPTDLEPEKPTWQNFPHKRQLFILSLCRLSTPLSHACLLPYLYALVASVLSSGPSKATPESISRLTGLLVAAFPLGQVLTSMLWGRLSDSYGRKPVICLGLAVTVIANTAFGFSTSFGTLILWRVVSGMANGTLGVMRSMAADLGGRKHQSRAFLAPPVVFNSGRVVALAVGGCLADPVVHLPGVFGPKGWLNLNDGERGVEWLLKYPYALPVLFNAGTLAMCLGVAAVWMQESQTGKDEGLGLVRVVRRLVSRVMRQENHEYALVNVSDPEKPSSHLLQDDSSFEGRSKRPARPFRDIWTPHLLRTLLAFTLLPLHNTSFLHIFPVLLSMPVFSSPPHALKFTGGLGLSPPTIGLFLATLGILGILLQLFTYPRLHTRIGTLGIFRLANCIFTVVYAFAPYLALLAGQGVKMWVALVAVLGTQVLARTMAIPSSVMLLTDAAPERSVLGTVHGAGNTAGALAGAIGPAVAGVVLARGIEVGVGGLVWWAWLGSVACVGFAWSLVLKGKGVGSEYDEG